MSNAVHSSRKELYIFIALLIAIFLLHSSRSLAQNVGIGTTSPLARLHVTDSVVLFSAAGPIENPTVSTYNRVAPVDECYGIHKKQHFVSDMLMETIGIQTV